MNGLRRWLALLALSLLCVLARSAAAASGSAPIVSIEVEGTPAAVERLRTTATEVLGRLGVVPVVVTAPAPPTRTIPVPLIQAQVDLRNARQPSLVVRDGGSGRELGRRTLDSSASLETSVEAAVLVIYMIVEARLSEEPPSPPAAARPGEAPASPAAAPSKPNSVSVSVSVPAKPVSSKAARAPAPPKKRRAPEVELPAKAEDAAVAEEIAEPQRPSTPSPWTLSAGVLLRVGTLDNESAITGAGLLLEARAKRSQFGGLLLGAAHVPSDVQFESSYADLHTVSVRLLATQGFLLGSSASALFGLGPGIDWLRSVPEAAPVEVRSGAANVVDPILSAAFGARLTLGGHALLMAVACLDLDLAPHTFVVDVGNQRHTLLAPDRLRPSLQVAIAYTSGDEQRAATTSSTGVW